MFQVCSALALIQHVVCTGNSPLNVADYKEEYLVVKCRSEGLKVVETYSSKVPAVK